MSDAPAAAPAAAETKPKPKFQPKPKLVEDENTKAYRIKVSTVVRNVKDYNFANNEVDKEKARLEKIKVEDPEKVNQQTNVIAEASMMIPHAINRIRASLGELKELIEEADAPTEETKEKAAAAVASAEEVLAAHTDDQ